jgi:hypothetical protein
VRRLADSAHAPEHSAADRPQSTADATGSNLAALRDRLRSLAPNHASAIPREIRTPEVGKPAIDSAAQRGPDPPRRPEQGALSGFDTLTSRFWEQIDHLRSVWADHLQRWPRPAVRERLRPDDPAGSWRGPGDRTLRADENAQADQVIAALQECEPAVTGFLQQLESQSPFGARLVGLEHRLKGPDRLKEKLVDELWAEETADVTNACSVIFDAVRYSYCCDVDQYAESYADVHERLESAGYRMIFRANRWVGDPEYRGLNTRWLTPDGDRFELQFHTPESFFAKEYLTHGAYDRLRTPGSAKEEEAELLAYERLVCSAIPEPDRIREILDVRPS